MLFYSYFHCIYVAFLLEQNHLKIQTRSLESHDKKIALLLCVQESLEEVVKDSDNMILDVISVHNLNLRAKMSSDCREDNMNYSSMLILRCMILKRLALLCALCYMINSNV